MLATGGRTSLLSVIELIVMLAVYRRHGQSSLRSTSVLTLSFLIVGLLGIFLAAFRAGGQLALVDVLTSVAYGNTFSDVRDGAFILSGWQSVHAGELLSGRTYAAGLLSFIPSSMSEFRTEWSWGYFTTEELLGYENHYGFRGGWSLEAYLNFGVPGVILFALACGWILGRLEGSFHAGFIAQRQELYPSAYAQGWLGYSVFTVLIASSATYNLYTILALFGCVSLTGWFTKGMKGSASANPTAPKGSLNSMPVVSNLRGGR
jgi:hypothetical protein